MILYQATIKYKGYDPLELSKSSHKRICCSCDMCGRVRWTPKYNYRSLCVLCSRIGMKGKHHTNKSKKKNRISHLDKTHTDKQKKNQSKRMMGKNNPNYSNHKLAGKNNPMFGKRGELSPNYGKKFTNEHCKHLSQSLINHHYIYDHSDLSKYTILITRKQHGLIHKCLNRMGIKVPHINEV